jgi:putative ABC transport system permease protein
VTVPPDADFPSGTFRVVGVAENVAYDGLGEQDTRRYIRYADTSDPRARREDVYLPLAQFPARTVSVAVFTRGHAGALLEPLRRRIGELSPASAVHWTSTMADELAVEFAPSRFYAILVSAFSASALALTGVGLFAVLSHEVARRTREIGLRLALGATPSQVVRLVLSGGLGPLGVGIALGLAGAASLARLLGGLLYGVPALDGLAFVGAAILLLLVALPAGLLPARRAALIEPLRAIQGE